MSRPPGYMSFRGKEVQPEHQPADELLELRRRLALARLLIQLHAPPLPERRQAIAAIDEVLPLLYVADE